jgi:hypothetical protein
MPVRSMPAVCSPRCSYRMSVSLHLACVFTVRRLGGLLLDQSLAPLGSDNDVNPTQLYIMIVAKVGKKQLLRR